MVIKNKDELEMLREGGKKLAAILNDVRHYAVAGVSSKELDELAEKLILKAGGKPSFKGYKIASAPISYPGSLCVSINDEIVHGLPTDRILQSGDVVGLDIGMKWPFEGGFFTDMAVTVLVPRGKMSSVFGNSTLGVEERGIQLISATKKSLEIGIVEVRAGVRVGDVGYAIQQFLEKNGFGVVRELVGHGVGIAVHEDPEIPNWGHRGQGAELVEGMVIAIEPMATEGSHKIKLAKDGWTWLTRDGGRAAHFEHTMVVTRTGVEVLTVI